MGKVKLSWTLAVLIFSTIACNLLTKPEPSETPEPDEPTRTLTPSPQPPDDIPPTASETPTPLPPVGSPDGPPTLTLPAPEIDPAAAIPHLNPGQDFSITYIDMQSNTNGWAIAAAGDPSDHILRTRDGGKTWTDVTPPEPAPTGGESYKLAHTFFQDDNTGWVTYSFEEFHDIPEYPIVWYTQDGGSTWQPSAFLETRGASMEFYSPSYLQFIDPLNGWLLVAVGAGMSHSYSLLFRTSDGGETWARIIDPMTSVDMHHCCKTGLAFKDTLTGLVTSGQGPYVEPYVTWTRDGGLTWEHQPLPDPASNPNLFDDTFCETHSPHFFDTNAVLVGVFCKEYGDAGGGIEHNYIYTSLDDGDTWVSSPAGGSGPLFFFDEDIGFILGRDIYFTNDGGLTWALVKTVNWFGQFSFVDRDTGWVVARQVDQIALLSTTNGGSTWQEIEPVIGD